MKESFSRAELLKWIDATRADLTGGPALVMDNKKSWTAAQINEAWALSAKKVLNELEKFIEESYRFGGIG